MSGYLNSITPDSFSGILFALEGIAHTVTLINGPTGCKFYHSATSDNQTIRQFEFDPLNYPEKWYFGQPRVPCTYLDSGDYIYGSREKLTEALEFLQDHVAFDLLCIVNSPGAALIGDDLVGIAGTVIRDKPVVLVETPGFSSDICTGYENAVLHLLENLLIGETPYIAPDKESVSRHSPQLRRSAEPDTQKRPRVNILGLSIFHKYYAGDAAELERLFNLCGIDVNCILCAGCSLESIQNIEHADLNVVLHPEYGLRTANYLNEHFGTLFYRGDGLPLGFSAVESFFSDICEALDTETSAFTEECDRARGRVYPYISRVNSLTGLPKGVEFAVEGTYSELYSYIRFLTQYLGMIPECASIQNIQSDCAKGRLQELLTGLGLPQILDCDISQTRSELVLGSGNTIAGLRARKHEFVGIETCLPTLGYIDIIPKTHLGIQGALMLVEQVLNGLLF